MKRWIAPVAAALVLLSACTSHTGNGASPTTLSNSSPSLPQCSEIWVVGQTLPTDYDGCSKDATTEAAVTASCTDGDTFTTYEDRLWAKLGGPIAATTSPGYTACRG